MPVSGIMNPMRSRNSQPPLLQTYSAPSGPIAAPFGLPPGDATVSLLPSGRTRVMHPPPSSTTRTEPSSSATGPSGNFSPDATSVICGSLMLRAHHPVDSTVKDAVGCTHAHTSGSCRRVHARARVGVELQRVDVLQRLRPG